MQAELRGCLRSDEASWQSWSGGPIFQSDTLFTIAKLYCPASFIAARVARDEKQITVYTRPPTALLKREGKHKRQGGFTFCVAPKIGFFWKNQTAKCRKVSSATERVRISNVGKVNALRFSIWDEEWNTHTHTSTESRGPPPTRRRLWLFDFTSCFSFPVRGSILSRVHVLTPLLVSSLVLASFRSHFLVTSSVGQSVSLPASPVCSQWAFVCLYLGLLVATYHKCASTIPIMHYQRYWDFSECLWHLSGSLLAPGSKTASDPPVVETHSYPRTLWRCSRDTRVLTLQGHTILDWKHHTCSVDIREPRVCHVRLKTGCSVTVLMNSIEGKLLIMGISTLPPQWTTASTATTELSPSLSQSKHGHTCSSSRELFYISKIAVTPCAGLG